MNPKLPGLHHVTAITADAQKNLDFYCGVLGLRLVKITVNFDDPTSYHLYYGDAQGNPGTIMTFFAWPGAGRGRVGPPQVIATSFAVNAGALNFWEDRLRDHNVPIKPTVTRFGEEILGFEDPDGMGLEIVAGTGTKGPTASGTTLNGFHSVTLAEEGHETTARLLTEVMGFHAEGSEGNRFRYRAEGDGFASAVDLLCVAEARHGSLGAGIVHHVAFRTPDDAQQRAWRETIARSGFNVSPVMDRNYFHSIYYREPGGVLFEIATDPPGFSADEPADQMGTQLKLPPELEGRRSELIQVLPKLRLPARSL